MASDPAKARPPRTRGTTTRSFGTGSRENHDASAFYSRNLAQAEVSTDDVLREELGFLMRGEVIWRKGKASSNSTAWGSWLSASNPIFRDIHEYCLCFSKGRVQRVSQGKNTIQRDDFLESTPSVWDIQPDSARSVGHPAPFPVELPRRFIELYTYEDDVVLDPFIGSGSTALAAVGSGPRYVGYETNEEYVALALASARPAAERPET